MGQEQNKYLNVGKKLAEGNERGRVVIRDNLGVKMIRVHIFLNKTVKKTNLIKGFQVADNE